MSWKQIKLGDLFEQYRIQHTVQDDRDYGQITISKNGYVKFRTTKNGKTIGRKRQFIIDLEQYPNTLLFTRQGVSEGAIAFAPKEVNGCIATENMPMFSLKNGVSRKFVELLLKSEQYISKVKKLIPTGSAQKSIHERDLMQISLSLPDVKEQKKLSEIIDSHLDNINVLNTEIETQQILLKKLRQSILQEAIEGKLTVSWREQNHNVESASVLLEKIKAEKEQLIQDKKIKKGKKQPPNKMDNFLLNIPDTWTYPDLDDITQYITDGTHQTPTYTTSGRIFLSAQNVKPFRFIPEIHRYVSEKDYQAYIANRFTEKGDLLLGRVGAGIGETAVVDIDLEFAIYVSLGLVKTFKEHTNSDYLAIVFNSPYGVKYAKGNISSSGGSAGNFNLGRIRSFPIPFPSQNEQNEIVKKMENLFKICDELETQINSSKINGEVLIRAVLKEAFEND
jgi:type I restriction enzyme S subunit